MNKIILPLFILGMTVTNAQSYIDDAIDATVESLEGDARYRGMAGSMGALGSNTAASININPAGAALAVTSDANITLSINKEENKIIAPNTLESGDQTNFNISQFGGIWYIDNSAKSNKWKSFTISGGYARSNRLDRTIEMSEFDESLTYSDNYLYDSDGDNIGEEYFGDYILDGQTTTIKGYKERVALNLSANYNDKFYFGAGFNFHGLRRDLNHLFLGTNTTETDLQGERIFNDVSIGWLSTGSGFSLTLGAIAKLNDEIRLGLAYETPTWWYVENESYRSEEIYNSDNSLNQSYTYDPAIQSYDMQTPSKLTGSIGAILAKKVAFNGDIIYRNYGNIKFSNMYYAEDEKYINADVNTLLQNTLEYRIGAELKLGNFKLRGGFKTMDNPYKNLDKRTNTFAGGLGYSYKTFYIDTSYDYTKGYSPFFPKEGALFDTDGYGVYYDNQFERSNFLLTLGFKF